MNTLSQARICLVDDDPGNRDLLKTLFRSRQLRVSTFDDPGRFLSIWMTSELREVPATFVIDVAMPSLSGLELFRLMREHGLPAYNAVVLTGRGGIPMAVEAVKHGAFDFIEKPFSTSLLVERVVESMAVVEEAFAHCAQQLQHEAVLDERERDVAELVSRGLTNKDIATRLNASIRTVQMYRSHVFEKLRVKNAVQLANVLLQAGGSHIAYRDRAGEGAHEGFCAAALCRAGKAAGLMPARRPADRPLWGKGD